MKPRRAGTSQAMYPYENQWRTLRLLSRFTQRDVIKYLEHLNTDHYQDIERGRIFPQAKILFRLLALYRIELSQAYPVLMMEAESAVKRLSI
jgi:predicted flavoprotein YhiN